MSSPVFVWLFSRYCNYFLPHCKSWRLPLVLINSNVLQPFNWIPPPLSNSFASYLNQRIILSRPMPTLKSLILMEIRQVSLISLYQLMRPVDLDITFSKWKTNKNNNNKKDSTKHVCPAEDVRSSDRHFDAFQRRTSDICTSLRQYDDLVCFCLLFFLFVFCVSLASFMSKHHKWTWLETSCASRSFV